MILRVKDLDIFVIYLLFDSAYDCSVYSNYYTSSAAAPSSYGSVISGSIMAS